jgi:hypothetical protein
MTLRSLWGVLLCRIIQVIFLAIEDVIIVATVENFIRCSLRMILAMDEYPIPRRFGKIRFFNRISGENTGT